MKQNNYYAVHKNKKPKRRLENRKFNLLKLKLLMYSASHIAQHAIIVSQNFNSVAEKSLAILENVKNQAENINKILSDQKKYKYLSKQKATLNGWLFHFNIFGLNDFFQMIYFQLVHLMWYILQLL